MNNKLRENKKIYKVERDRVKPGPVQPRPGSRSCTFGLPIMKLEPKFIFGPHTGSTK